MGKAVVLFIGIIIIFIYREWKYRSKIQDIINTLDEILAGNENLKIRVGYNESIAPLVFKINQLVDYYQSDSIKTYKKDQARKQMFSNLSHDVRTPLTSVLGYLEALCNGMVGEESDEYLNIAKNKAYELKEYIDELFTIARMDANEIQLLFESIDLFEFLRSELIAWVPELQRQNIILDIQIPDEECFVTVDQHALNRVFNNLFQNAVRYGGSSQFVGVLVWSDDTNAFFQVWDKGPGLTEDEVSKVFERLYKADSSRSNKGHGLGLTIAKELVQKMNGTISVESIPFTKTFVQVVLPKVFKPSTKNK